MFINENTQTTCINKKKYCYVPFWMRKAFNLLPNVVCWLVLLWALCLSFVHVWACLLHQFAVLGSQAAQRYAKQPWRVPHRKHEKQPTPAQWATLHTGIYWASVLAHFFPFFFFSPNSVPKCNESWNGMKCHENVIRFKMLPYFVKVWEIVRIREYFCYFM